MNTSIFLQDLERLILAIIPDIQDDYIDEEGDEPFIQLTVGSDGTDWSWQTGDNSYTGGAYAYPHWAIVYITRDCDPMALALDIENQILDLMAA